MFRFLLAAIAVLCHPILAMAAYDITHDPSVTSGCLGVLVTTTTTATWGSGDPEPGDVGCYLDGGTLKSEIRYEGEDSVILVTKHNANDYWPGEYDLISRMWTGSVTHDEAVTEILVGACN